MIRLFRPPEPTKLAAKKREWTDRWIRVRAGRSGEWATQQAKHLLREELRPMSFGKCAFCEGPLEAQAATEIEHYHAKSIRDDLAFDWPNLFLACRKCNGAKLAADHKGTLLKPDVDDGELHLWVNKGTGELEAHPGLAQAHRLRAEETIRICKLNRGELCADRLRYLAAIKQFVDLLREQVPAEAPVWLSPATPYKLTVRFQFHALGLSALAEEDRRLFEQASRSTE